LLQVPGESDESHLARVLRAFEVIGILPEEQMEIFRVLAAVLHLGDLQFAAAPNNGSSIKDPAPLHRLGSILGVPEKELEAALLRKKIKAGAQEMVVNLIPEKAELGRDTLAMSLYSRLFLHIVKRMNVQLGQMASAAAAAGLLNFIGVLDIYGFEVFEHNSFEQLCINYANEKLQSLFNDQVLQYEQQEYVKEGIQWTNIEYKDNKECLELIEKKPGGLLSLLDEESQFPKATDDSFALKLYANLSKSKYFEKPRFGNQEFIVRHYAAKVSLVQLLPLH
jgi:myosin-5